MTSEISCPNCGTPSPGANCSHCGWAADGTPPADRFQIREMSLKPLADQVKDLEVRMKYPDVIELAESIRKYGAIHPPLISKKTHRVIAGRDRIAAHAILGTPTIVVKVIRCTAGEAEALENEENVRRRRDPRVRTAVMLETLEEMVLDGVPEAEATATVAEQHGIKPASVKRTQRRERKGRSRPKEEAPQVIPSIETFGVELDPQFLQGVKTFQLRLDNSLEALSKAVGPLRTLLRQHQDIIHRGTVERLVELVERCRTDIKDEFPVTLCPYCKGSQTVRRECTGCMRAGFVGRKALSAAPPELTQTESLKVSYHGQLVELSRLGAPPDDDSFF